MLNDDKNSHPMLRGTEALMNLIAKHNTPTEGKPKAYIRDFDLGDEDCAKIENAVYGEGEPNKVLFMSRDYAKAVQWVKDNGFELAE